MANIQPALSRLLSAPKLRELRSVMPRLLTDELVAKGLDALLADETILDDSLPGDVPTCPEAGQGLLPSAAPLGTPTVAPGRTRTL